MGDVTTGMNIGVWFPVWWHTPSGVGSSRPGWKGVGRMIRAYKFLMRPTVGQQIALGEMLR
ncbi:hypothetical protein ACFCX0_49020, partial [Streptomyces sp. NPDC056352]|uniref:hypothetical protein n=1 Tax=Streptomyces sp. NPDC056352 TaxID=3345791 RepID=UPI0035DCD816